MKEGNLATTRKFLAYSAAATAFLAGAVGAEGQVVYTDVDPDEVLNTGETFSLDLNNDGQVDFLINNRQETLPSFFYVSADNHPDARITFANIEPQEANSIGGQWPYLFYAYQLPVDYLIGYDLNFQNLPAHLFYKMQAISYPAAGSSYVAVDEGNFLPDSTGFAPLILQLSGETHFGWVRLEVSSTQQVTIKDYAYEETIEEPILTFDSTAVVPVQIDLAALEPTIFSYGQQIFIDMDGIADSGAFEVLDLQGRKLESGILSGQGVQNFPMQHPSGVYLIKVQWGNRVYTRKLYV
jgi:hypothetical protein